MTTSKQQTEALIMAGLNLIQPALSIYDQGFGLFFGCGHPIFSCWSRAIISGGARKGVMPLLQFVRILKPYRKTSQ